MERPRVIIIGGGFGGLYAARALRDAPVRVTVVDRTNHHVFQPLLYQVATATLTPSDIAAPIRWLLRNQKNAQVLLAEVKTIDPDARIVHCVDGERLDYDYLIVAAGARHSYFGHNEWEKLAPGLKTLEDAVEIRRRILLAFEYADRIQDDAARRAAMTFVIIGGGPTGVEMAGAIAEISRYTLAKNYRHINPRDARVIIVEGGDRLLGGFPEDLSASALKQLQELGVEVILNDHAKNLTEQ